MVDAPQPDSRRYTAPPLPSENYTLVTKLTLRHPAWAIKFDADQDGEVLYHAVNSDRGIYIAVCELRDLARLLAAAEEGGAT